MFSQLLLDIVCEYNVQSVNYFSTLWVVFSQLLLDIVYMSIMFSQLLLDIVYEYNLQ